MKKTQKCFSGSKHGHFQQPEQQIEFLHLKRKTDATITHQAIKHDGRKLSILPFTQHCIRTSTGSCKHNDVKRRVLFIQEPYFATNCQKILRCTKPFSDMWLDLAENNGCILRQTAKDDKTPVFVKMQSSYMVDDDGAKICSDENG